jgi:hypothetical protein
MPKRSDLFWDKLGHITIEWSRVEKVLDDLITEVAGLGEPHIGAAFTGKHRYPRKNSDRKKLGISQEPSTRMVGNFYRIAELH